MCLPAVVWAVLAACASASVPLNYRPVIGVLAQENLESDTHAQGSSYIAASYVKYLESAGARVVPIRINGSEEDYTKIFYAINGLLLPGGDVDLQKSQFSRVSKIFYELAIKANDAADYFPIWGTCQGFQQLTVLTSSKNLLTLTNTKAVALPLVFTQGAQNSRLFKNFPKDLLLALSEENITSNFHSWSLSLQNYTRNAKLKRFYKVLSTNSDGRKEFISTMEDLTVSDEREPGTTVGIKPKHKTSDQNQPEPVFGELSRVPSSITLTWGLSIKTLPLPVLRGAVAPGEEPVRVGGQARHDPLRLRRQSVLLHRQLLRLGSYEEPASLPLATGGRESSYI
uniref:folate gamma-glutamyl hydrolase n=1 Tax=Astyanax mexicanus TaxID=7994 RepID=A0A8B9KDX5_ASTMX